MAEAYSDHGNLCLVGIPNECFECRNEGQILVSPVARPADKPAIGLMDRGWKFTIDDEVGIEIEPVTVEQLHIHLRVVAMRLNQVRRKMSCLQDSDFHFDLSFVGYAYADIGS